MLKKSSLENILSEGLYEIWSLLTPEEKRRIADNFVIHNFKRNQIIYAEGDDPEYLWCLLSGKVKKFKDGIGGRQQILRVYRPIQYIGYRAFFAKEKICNERKCF